MRCEWGAFEEGHGRESEEAFVKPLPGPGVLALGRLRFSVGLDSLSPLGVGRGSDFHFSPAMASVARSRRCLFSSGLPPRRVEG